MRVMIVEDEFIIAEDLKLTLQNFGHEIVSIVSSGEEAIDYANRFLPDIIFMDIVLDGEINGIDAAIKIKAKYEIPIIFCSAYIDSLTQKEASQIKPGIFISKPVEESKVQTALDNFLELNLNAGLAM